MNDTESMKIGCVVMAAGNSRRFNGNKLLARFRGKALIDYALLAVPAGRLKNVVVVSQYPEILEKAEAAGFSPLLNDKPELGLSRTVRLGTQALYDCDAILYMVADQPMLRRETVEAELTLFSRSPGRIVMLCGGDRRGNPSIFPREFFDELTALTGDEGGIQVVRRHPERLSLCPAPELELCDVDSGEALELLRKL